MRLLHSPPVLSPAQPPPSPESHWTFLEPGLLHIKGWLQSAQPVPADGGPQWAGVTGAEGPGRAGKPGYGPSLRSVKGKMPMGVSPSSSSAAGSPDAPLG